MNTSMFIIASKFNIYLLDRVPMTFIISSMSIYISELYYMHMAFPWYLENSLHYTFAYVS